MNAGILIIQRGMGKDRKNGLKVLSQMVGIIIMSESTNRKNVCSCAI